MISSGHFQPFNHEPNVKPMLYYKPRVINVIFFIAVMLFIAQGCSESGLMHSQLNAIGQGTYKVKTIEDRRQGFIEANTIFTEAFNPLQKHDGKGSEADGTLVVKALGEDSGNPVF